jgi:hypothetical protein
MKVSGSGPSLPPDGAAGVGEAGARDAVEKTDGPAAKVFAEQVDRGEPPQAVREAASAGRVSPVADIVADLRAGRITPEAALDRVIDRVLTQKVGPDAPAAVREQVGAALRRALEDDPLLADKLRALYG